MDQILDDEGIEENVDPRSENVSLGREEYGFSDANDSSVVAFQNGAIQQFQTAGNTSIQNIGTGATNDFWLNSNGNHGFEAARNIILSDKVTTYETGQLLIDDMTLCILPTPTTGNTALLYMRNVLLVYAVPLNTYLYHVNCDKNQLIYNVAVF
ncbi:unnamed protein product [Adineta steineri]|uniref:Uncharacterized protein n=1 Tax=Adineta steineri TaxID=433720 RepID=A0A815HCM1_9BILA|nr:unnamed protein product [Adineta steineri]CAF1350010.1 unnamed protein product [Adineta steineri]